MRFDALIPLAAVALAAGLYFGSTRAPFDWLGGFIEEPAPGGVPLSR